MDFWTDVLVPAVEEQTRLLLAANAAGKVIEDEAESAEKESK